MKKPIYLSPTVETFRFSQMAVVCASNGETQDYGSGSIFDAGSDNEG